MSIDFWPYGLLWKAEMESETRGYLEACYCESVKCKISASARGILTSRKAD